MPFPAVADFGINAGARLMADASRGDRPGNSGHHLPGEAGIWVLVIGDLMVFGLLFLVFVFNRAQSLDLYKHSQTALSQMWGLVNTFLMLSSSWFVALGIRAFRGNDRAWTPPLVWCAFACAATFCIVKYFEWAAKFHAGITISSNEFFMYYFVLTGIHLMHVLIGMGVLAFMARYSKRGPLIFRAMTYGSIWL